ncbi:hypothetical protein Rhopal_007497-T1 [Rhodotorula paludigena]|uniref:Phosphoglycerate mutase-like protein n=1 Tax=Rhodotorula paludigena TaxID=86838 RepID=A0AAV5GZL0_9BASI|nr:hypothetical protein Rhopal_007497-T1 [Rhodotorula paludigena]
MARQHEASDSDVESNSPLLPGPGQSPSSASSPDKRSPIRTAWAYAVLGSLGLGIVWLAFGQSYLDSRDGLVPSTDDPHFPTSVGYAGPTPTGGEAFAAATSYPSNFDSSPLHPPPELVSEKFNILHYLGNLSPWRTVNHGLKGTAQIPQGCTVEQVQLLHRHGARYPTTGAGTEAFAKDVVGAPGFKASGNLSFLNSWKYQLGAEILTPFGREQLFNLGVSFRTKYGHLLDPKKKPVFRTESQDRMLKSAQNFAAGFFGIPFEQQYHQLVTIEWPGFNNTLAPYMTCKNAIDYGRTRAPQKMAEWIKRYLDDALQRVQPLVEGVTLRHRDLFNMQLLCAYELVALGGSAFCPLFTEDEWRGFEYAHDIEFYDAFSYGQGAQAAVGKGWVQEWLARTTKQPLKVFDSTTNSTLHTPEFFPLDQQLYVDATHDTIISAVITTLGFSSFARSGPLPTDHIPSDLSFVTSSVSPFAANLHSQVLSCPSSSLVPKGKDARFVRWVLNDGVVPLDHIEGCATNDDGLCHLDAFVQATKDRIESIDWAYDCLGDWPLPEEPIKDGRPPRRD